MKKLGLAILFVIAVMVSFWAGGRFDSMRSTTTDTQGQRKVLYYVDPMTPGFRSDKPGIAPCGMPLEPVYADGEEGPNGSMQALPQGAVKVSPKRQQLIGVTFSEVEPQPLTYTLRLYGKVVADETRIFRLNASTDSWMKEVSDVTTGSFVKKDQVLAEALAPAYYNAQVTYLISLDNIDRIKQQLGGELRHQQSDLADNQIRVAVQALQNLGIGDAQVEELANTRQARPYLQVRSPSNGFVLNRNVTLNQWFKAGEEFYTIADIRKVWVYADVYEDEARYLRPGMKVKIEHSQMGKSFDAKVSKVLPLFDPISKTLKVRLDVANPHYDLRPDMFVDIEIPITMPSTTYVSTDAIINSGTKDLVYVNLGDGVLAPRQVETGWKLGRWVEITSGLMPGEQVVTSGNFLIDSESRMKTAASAESALSKDLVCGMQVEQKIAVESGNFVQGDGHVYYFCSPDCKEKFLAEQDQYVKKEEGIKDPVCHMTVNELKAEYAGLFVKLDGKPYHFCSSKCMLDFLKEPQNYIEKNQTAKREHNTASQPPKKHNSVAATTEAQAHHEIMGHDTKQTNSTQKPKDKNPHTSPSVINWKRPKQREDAKAAKDWGGWGQFPGAKYLGMKQPEKSKEQQ